MERDLQGPESKTIKLEVYSYHSSNVKTPSKIKVKYRCFSEAKILHKLVPQEMLKNKTQQFIWLKIIPDPNMVM